MTEQYGWDYAGWDADPGPTPEELARAERTRAERYERMAAGWNPDGRNTGRRTLTGAEALRQLGEQDATAPTPVMRRIAAEAEQRAFMEAEGQRALDWLGSHATGNVGP